MPGATIAPPIFTCIPYIQPSPLAIYGRKVAWRHEFSGMSLSPATIETLFLRQLARWDADYDEAVGLIKRPFSSPGYHTTLNVDFAHPTRESLIYAVACLDAGDTEHVARAARILRQIAALQDTDPAHDTYGIWSWFAEEPLTQMAPPDWNWADFCGTQLLQVLLDHRAVLDAELAAQVEQAVYHACGAIIRRNVGPGYTNIALMGTYVTLVAGERFGWAEVAEYGRQRLARFAAYTQQRGTFDEYNSPTYTRVAITELSRLLLHAQDTQARAQIDELVRFAWRHLARHYHPPTRQWAGPHSRCYRTLQGAEFTSFLQWASDGRLASMPDEALVIEIDWPRLGLQLPEEVLPCFAPLDEPRTTIETYISDTIDVPAAGTAYLAPAFTLASIAHGDLWNQRRPVLAYWGSADAPSWLRLRLLVDGYDFSSGYLFTRQQQGTLLAVATSVTDRGRTHICLDPIHDGQLTFHDWRLRLEIGGPAAAGITTGDWDFCSPRTLTLDGLALHLQVPATSFAGGPAVGACYGPEAATALLRLPHGARIDPQPQAALDVILYHSTERTMALTDLSPLYVGLALSLGSAATPPPALATPKGDRLTLTWPTMIEPLTAPIGPLPRATMKERMQGM